MGFDFAGTYKQTTPMPQIESSFGERISTVAFVLKVDSGRRSTGSEPTRHPAKRLAGHFGEFYAILEWISALIGLPTHNSAHLANCEERSKCFQLFLCC
jgi:hypothetical protein